MGILQGALQNGWTDQDAVWVRHVAKWHVNVGHDFILSANFGPVGKSNGRRSAP